MIRTAIALMILAAGAACAQYLDPNVARGIDQNAKAEMERLKYLRKAMHFEMRYQQCLARLAGSRGGKCAELEIQARALRAKAAAGPVPGANATLPTTLRGRSMLHLQPFQWSALNSAGGAVQPALPNSISVTSPALNPRNGW